MFKKQTPSEKLMKALKEAHSCSVDLRYSLNNDDQRMGQAFNFNLRISELLRDVGNNFRLQELS